MKGLTLLSLMLVLAGCGRSEAKREFERALVALKVCAASSTATESEFHGRRTDLETTFELHKRSLARFHADYAELRDIVAATENVWIHSNTERFVFFDECWDWRSILVISPEMALKPKPESRKARDQDREYRHATHIARGRMEVAWQCENLLKQMQ